jgi:hypothetical protein
MLHTTPREKERQTVGFEDATTTLQNMAYENIQLSCIIYLLNKTEFIGGYQ